MKHFLTSLICLALFTLLLGIFYPFLVYAIGQLCFAKHANGSLVYRKGVVVGSEWIGQRFTRKEYFHPRPSHAGIRGYDGWHSSGSNLGPTSQKLADLLARRAGEYRTENQLDSNVPIPCEAITASGSGLDPHISLADARLQASRVARAGSLPEEKVHGLILKYRERPVFGVFGEGRVNVLRINLALDEVNRKRDQESSKADPMDVESESEPSLSNSASSPSSKKGADVRSLNSNGFGT